jgi:hypothetical protein
VTKSVLTLPLREARSKIRQDRLVLFSQLRQCLVARSLRKDGRRLALEKKPELKGIMNQLHVGMDHLRAALRHRHDEPFDLEAGDQFSNGAQGQPGKLRKLALGKKLSGPDASREEVTNKALIRLFAQFLGLAFSVGRFYTFVCSQSLTVS